MPNNIVKTAFTTYILTGGKSSRMGSDKAVKTLNGSTFFQHITKALENINTQIIVVSSRPEHTNLGFPIIHDIDTNKGPVCAITSALKESNSVQNAIISCDTPLLKPSFFDWILNEKTDNYNAVIPLVNGKRMPLNALYNKNCFPVFEKHLKANQLKLMTVLDDLKINYTEAPANIAHQLKNINTPEELKSIQ